MRTRLLVVALLTVSSTAGAQATIGADMQRVRALTTAGNHDAAVALADSVVARVPNFPNAVFLRAVTLAKAGRHSDAAKAVRILFNWNPRMAQQALRDSALSPLWEEFRAAHIDSLAAIAARPTSTGRVWATIEDRDLIPEGTAYDPGTRSVLLGSVNKRKIVAIAPDGTVSDRVASGAGGVASIVGIHVDTLRGLLWVASNPRFDTPSDTTKAALFAFDAATGAFRRRIDAPGTGHFLNDLTTGPDGTVYVTDSRQTKVWLLRPGSDSLQDLAAIGPLLGANGITMSADGRHLFVADIDHIRVLPLVTRQAAWRIEVPDSMHVNGIDGLAFHDGSLIAHHPLAFWRVVRYQLDPAMRRIVGQEYIERNTPDSRTSTTGELVGDYYVYIGNSQIDRMNARTIDAATMEPIRIYRAPLR
jgi:hypothetical protein